MAERVEAASSGGPHRHCHTMEMLRQWFIEDRGENQRFLWEQDKPVVEWLEEQVSKNSCMLFVLCQEWLATLAKLGHA